MEELKPCPFCGGEAKIGAASVYCDNCPAIIWAQPYDNIDFAIEAWNRRAAPENKPLTLEQLRQMDGQPVWCEIPQDNPQYGLVSSRLECVSLANGVLSFKYYGEWKAYARNPEGESNGINH